MASIHYQVSSSNPAGHYFDISLTIDRPEPEGQLLRLPAWIPGSYMIRDFARHIVDIQARCDGDNITLTPLDKSSWLIAPCSGSVEISYRVYAWDLSVRGAHLDTTHGFFNGASVFLEVVGQGDRPCTVDIQQPQHPAAHDWRLATSMKRRDGREHVFEFGEFVADDYQELIDHPVEMGNFEQAEFSAGGILHALVLTGKFDCDYPRLCADLTRICQQQIDLFGAPPPMSGYLFLVMVVGEGYGGLEHRSSTALMCSRNDLPQPGQSDMSEQYRQFLGLCSHEYFHSWNVKRIKPEVFRNPDLTTEVYTPLLWAFEGITSYYDDLALVRCGCISPDDYLQLLAQTITRVARGFGRQRQSVAESSFYAWSKFYKQDENAANVIVSYYAKGSLVALCLDLKIRQLTDQEKSLDDVMRKLWQGYLASGKGVEDQEIQNTVNDVVGQNLDEFMTGLIETTDEPPLAELLGSVSVGLSMRASTGQQDKGGKDEKVPPQSTLNALLKENNGELQIHTVSEDGALQRAGMSAGDQIIAVNGLRANMAMINDLLKFRQPGSVHQFTVFRRDELLNFEVTLAAPANDTAVLSIIDPDDAALRAWLQPDA